MQISILSNFKYNNYSTSFNANWQSPKLKFKEKDFYVRIKGYGHHSDWAKKIKETADSAVSFIRRICNFEETLKKITAGVTQANKLQNDDIDKINHTGILRIKREGWRHGSDWGEDLITRYSCRGKNKYKTYANRFDYVAQHPLKNPFRATLTRPRLDKDLGKYLDHGEAKYINYVFEHVKMLYDSIYKKAIASDIKKENLTEINDSIAEIRWILAHATPWERGSDAISNTFIRSIYKAMGIKTTPLKKGVSLDLEAYCTELEEYKKKFPYYFTKKPKIID